MSRSLTSALQQLERQRTLRRDVASARVAAARQQAAAAQDQLRGAQVALEQVQSLHATLRCDTNAALRNPLHPAMSYCSDALVTLRGRAVVPARERLEACEAEVQRLRQEALLRERQLQRSQELLGHTRAAQRVDAERRLALEEEEWRPGGLAISAAETGAGSR